MFINFLSFLLFVNYLFGSVQLATRLLLVRAIFTYSFIRIHSKILKSQRPSNCHSVTSINFHEF